MRHPLRVLRKTAENSAQEFEEVMSTMRMASMRGRGTSTLIRCFPAPGDDRQRSRPQVSRLQPARPTKVVKI